MRTEITIGAIAILIMLSTIAVNTAMAYTIDAKLKPIENDVMKMPRYELQNIKITELPSKATGATLITMFGTQPYITVNPTYVGLSATLKYTGPDGSTIQSSTISVPEIAKIKGDTYTLESVLGPHGEMILGSNPTLHLEGVTNPDRN